MDGLRELWVRYETRTRVVQKLKLYVTLRGLPHSSERPALIMNIYDDFHGMSIISHAT